MSAQQQRDQHQVLYTFLQDLKNPDFVLQAPFFFSPDSPHLRRLVSALLFHDWIDWVETLHVCSLQPGLMTGLLSVYSLFSSILCQHSSTGWISEHGGLCQDKPMAVLSHNKQNHQHAGGLTAQSEVNWNLQCCPSRETQWQWPCGWKCQLDSDVFVALFLLQSIKTPSLGERGIACCFQVNSTN